MKTQTLTKIPTITDFKNAYSAFFDSIVENAFNVGEILVAVVEHDPLTLDKLAKEGFSRSTLRKLYDIGSGKLDPRLLIDDSPAALVISQLPLPQQKLYLDNGVKVVSVQGGKEIVRTKPVTELTKPETAKHFLSDGTERPLDEQRQIAAREASGHRREKAERFEIKNGKIIVLENTEFTIEQWRKILERAEAEALKSLPQDMKNRQLVR